MVGKNNIFQKNIESFCLIGNMSIFTRGRGATGLPCNPVAMCTCKHLLKCAALSNYNFVIEKNNFIQENIGI